MWSDKSVGARDSAQQHASGNVISIVVLDALEAVREHEGARVLLELLKAFGADIAFNRSLGLNDCIELFGHLLHSGVCVGLDRLKGVERRLHQRHRTRPRLQDARQQRRTRVLGLGASTRGELDLHALQPAQVGAGAFKDTRPLHCSNSGVGKDGDGREESGGCRPAC